MQQSSSYTFLVTGGAGFIGSHVVDTLLAEGHRVKVVDNFSTGHRKNIAHVLDQIELHETSITDLDALQKIMPGVDYVLHIAALPSVPRSVDDPIASNDNNVIGTLNVLVAARDAGVKRVVYSASSSAYGNVDAEYKTEDMLPRPLSPYAVAKLTGEMYCQAFANVYDLETVALRYFNVFGPRQDPSSAYAAVIPKFITAMLDDAPPPVQGDGEQSRDFTYIDNVVRGNLLACFAEGVSGEVFNVACGGSTTLLEMIDTLNDLMGKQIKPHFVPPRPGDVRHSRADINKARAHLGYDVTVSFEEGLRRTLEWYATSADA